MNGEEYEVNCETLEGEICDCCILALSGTELGKRRREADELETGEMKKV